MGKRFEKELGLRDKVMSLYLGLSFLVGIGILSCLSSALDHLLILYPFSVIFTFLPAWLYVNQKANLSYLSLLKEAEYFFLTHFLCLIGMTVELEQVGLHYMSVLPVLALSSQILNNWTLSRKEKTDRALASLVLVYTFFPIPFLVENSVEASLLSRLVVTFFFTWQVFSVFFAHFKMREFASNVRSFFKRSQVFTNHKSDHPLLKERYFFHDLINHTHAMDLMLRYKIMKNAGMNGEQVRELAEQVRMLQSLVKDHFGFAHKNLGVDSHGDRFTTLLFVSDSLINAFLPESSVQTFIRINDPENLQERVRLPIAAWQRVLTNLFKNASEAKCNSFELVFSFSKTGLTVETKNDFFRLDHLDGELGKGLSRVIENIDQASQKGPGLGLEAIQLLSLENGGSFSFSIENGLWRCLVGMDYLEIGEASKPSNSLNLNKKAS